MKEPPEQDLESLAGLLRESSSIVVFTGAGISTESGIPDYRSKGGLWSRFQPVTLQEFFSSEERRREYWEQKIELYRCFETARPNGAHEAIFHLDGTGKLLGVITQNIDELHQMAGLAQDKILELHGTNRKTLCWDCGDTTPWEDTFQRLRSGERLLDCRRCGGVLKPATISFGQNLDPGVLHEAFLWAGQCDLLLAVGSTLVVEPAASLPRRAKINGAKLAIVNLSETPLDDSADLVVHAAAGSCLKEAVGMLIQWDSRWHR
jgi:NAD-dependent deacetylase